MALQKSITLDNGVIAEYWKITQFNINNENNIVYLVLQGYLNQTVRLENKKPIEPKCYTITDTIIINKYFNDSIQGCLLPRPAGYTYIKENISEFTGALDV